MRSTPGDTSDDLAMRFVFGLLKSVLALSLLVGLVILAMLGLKWGLSSLFDGANETVTAAVVAAVATVLVSVFGVVYARSRERKDVVEREIRVRKIPMYTEFVTELFKIFDLGGNSGGSDDERTAELVRFMARITPELVTWASDDVLTTWSRYRRRAAGMSGEDSMFELERLLLAIRRDFGHPNKDVKDGDLLGLFVNDIDDTVAARSSAPRT